MTIKKLTRPLKVLLMGLGITATVSLGGCNAFGASNPKSTSSTTTYLCELAIENAKISTESILNSTEDTHKHSLILYYDVFNNSLEHIQQECPEDYTEAQGIQLTEPLVKALWEYKYKI